jgi:hypothetical protein
LIALFETQIRRENLRPDRVREVELGAATKQVLDRQFFFREAVTLNENFQERLGA